MTDFHKLFPKSGVGKQHQYLIDRLNPKHTILDYGCGKGGTIKWLVKQGFKDVVGYEPYVEEFSAVTRLDKRYDTIYTQDVLEHIHIDEIPWQLFKVLAQESVHIIDLTPAKKTLANGDNAHITLLPPDVWINMFATHVGTPIHHMLDIQPDPNFTTRTRLCLHIKH
jgi:hypothetical protein